MPASTETMEVLEDFADQGLITEVLYEVKSGKEATVFCCRGGSQANAELVAAKLYRPRERRNFRNDAVYQEGRVILDARIRRAFQEKTRMGMEAGFAMWVDHEYEILQTLHRAGAGVPRPIARSTRAVLMEFIGDEDSAGPILNRVRLDRDEAEIFMQVVLRNIEIMLANEIVHADLSAYNIMYWQGEVRIIDFPQAVDPRFNGNALRLLEHDVEQICRYFARLGVRQDPAMITSDLWSRYMLGEL